MLYEVITEIYRTGQHKKIFDYTRHHIGVHGESHQHMLSVGESSGVFFPFPGLHQSMNLVGILFNRGEPL